MTQWHQKGTRKSTGGVRNTVNRATKRLARKGGEFSSTTMAETQVIKVKDGRGRTHKSKVTKAQFANVLDATSKKAQKSKIVWVHENAANRLYVRRNIITKGTLIEVEGKTFARVTSRPGQDGVVNAVQVDAPIKVEKAPKAAGKTRNAPAPKAPKAAAPAAAKK